MENQTPIYNPDSEDFTITYDIHENGQPVSYTIHSREVARFPQVVADHITKHLAERIVQKRGVKHNWEMDLEGVRKEIVVEL